MTEDAKGSPDGIDVDDYAKGQTYELPPSLGEIFLDRGVAEEVERKPSDPNERETKPQTPTETKPDSPDTEKESDSSTPEESAAEEPEADSGEIEIESTSEGSPYYQFRKPDGELVTFVDDGEEKPVKVLGRSEAENKREELQERLIDDESDEE